MTAGALLSVAWSGFQPVWASADSELDLSLRGELEGVGEQVLEHLVEALEIGGDSCAAAAESSSMWKARFLVSATCRKLRLHGVAQHG